MTQRLITPDMKPRERFRPGDSVAHITMGDGVVISGHPDAVHVRYQRSVGIYDDRWFDLHPHFLFHRDTRSVAI